MFLGDRQATGELAAGQPPTATPASQAEATRTNVGLRHDLREWHWMLTEPTPIGASEPGIAKT